MTDERHEPEDPAPEPSPQVEPSRPVPEKVGVPWGIIFFVILSVLIAVFAVQNVQDVQLQFLGWSGEFPLILIVVGVFAIGVVLDEILGAVIRRRRRIRQAEKQELAGYRKK